MLIDTDEMQAREGRPSPKSVSSCRCFFKFDETSGDSFTDTITGNIYTPDDTTADAGAIKFNSDYSILIGDRSLATADFPQTVETNFGTKNVVMIAAGTWADVLSSLHCTIGRSTLNGSVGFSTSGSLHSIVSGTNGTNTGGSQDDNSIDVTGLIPTGQETVLVLKYSPASITISVLKLDGSVVGTDTYNNSVDPGTVVINPYARLRGLNYRGACWFAVSTFPDDIVEVALRQAEQWKLGRKILDPATVAWG